MSDVDLEELADRVAALERTVDKLYGVTREFRDVMVWFKRETDKLVSAAGPILAMAGPMLAQVLGQDPSAIVGEVIGQIDSAAIDGVPVNGVAHHDG